jgi:hypothetical protein
LGEHSEEVFKGVLGIDDETYASLVERGVIGES